MTQRNPVNESINACNEFLKLQGHLKEVPTPRTLRMIAAEINTHIMVALVKKPGKVPAWVAYARPYVSAMRELTDITDRYYLDSGYEIVLRAMCNLQSWRGDDARRIKAELQAHLDRCPVDKHL